MHIPIIHEHVHVDSRVLPLEDVLTAFWKEPQPMPLSFSGSQYRSAIFYHGDSQRHVAEHVRDSMKTDSPFSSPLDLTALEPAGPFYRAEDYHQRFLEKQRNGYGWHAAI